MKQFIDWITYNPNHIPLKNIIILTVIAVVPVYILFFSIVSVFTKSIVKKAIMALLMSLYLIWEILWEIFYYYSKGLIGYVPIIFIILIFILYILVINLKRFLKRDH